MKQSRCPWCGKKLRVHKAGIERFEFNLSIIHLCSQCSRPLSSWVSSVIWVVLLFFAIAVYLRLNWVFLVIVFVPLLMLYLLSLFLVKPKLYKTGADGKHAKGQTAIFGGILKSEEELHLCPGQILLTDKRFDDAKAYSLSAPIKILKYHKTTKNIEFEFLYENEQTTDLINGGSFEAYVERNDEMISVLIQKKT